MSFFGRAANLVKGGIKSLTRPSDTSERDRALEEELARGASRPAPAPTTATSPAPPRSSSEPSAERRPPERDEHGNVKRTL